MGGRLSSFLLDFVHLLQVLLRGGIQLCPKALLGLEGACLRFRNLVYFEPTSHGGVHHDLARRLDFLEGV